ncbi:hypothetical protein [Methylocella silvestris]|uniref:Uncharacterized protein n=1 Tax=Methylocella silvestris TaxID=199596 RepID=A0A2J7TCC5_METSI|nr:hypothetical protein [Methylocella silvestris]PNG24424.1 hypothetical protein CR492_18930 [Methylocella silvestris]
MNKIGAAVLFGLVAYALPAAAEVTTHAAPATETDDVTGTIGKDTAQQGGVSGGSSASSTLSYQQAFRSWRDCVATHQGGANPPPVCDPLRADLRRAMSERSRSEAAR